MRPIQVCLYLWYAWFAIWLAWAFQSKKTQQRESIASRFSYTGIIWVAAFIMVEAKRWPGWWNSRLLPDSPWIGWAGVGIAACGFAICFWARATLGSNWSGTVTIKVGHQLIRTGPYRLVRHPIYTGLVVAMAGTVLAHNQVRAYIALVLFWAGFTVKRLKEEQFMRQTFGEQYIEYARTTGAIFPNPFRHK
jgi:protein-S-isoprenylcysteine O-methyltransferase Ste14